MTPRVLAVADEREVLDAFRRALPRDWPVLTAATRAEALGVLRSGGPDVALVALDSGAEGYELASLVAAERPEVVVLLVVSSAGEAALRCAVEARIHGVLTYPGCVDEIGLVVEAHLEASRRSRAPSRS